MEYLLTRETKFPGDMFDPGPDLLEMFKENFQILVVGAGGLGCEILKNLALCQVNHIFVVDLDTIELSNLNRQFLFRKKDIGKYKAEVACEFIKNKYPHIDIKWSKHKIQEFSDDFFRQFNLIIGGLDNIEARRWINEKVHDLVQFDSDGNIMLETVIPFIDGGTEGFRGQSRLIFPYRTACFECTMSLFSDRKTYALCTIAETPRIPEHCIEYVYTLEWRRYHENPVDKDSIEDVQWIYEKALERANKFNIEGVTYNLTLGVIKNIIPAIASTNAVIAASTCMEAIKLITGCSKPLNNYFMYMGHEGLSASTTEIERDPQCNVCSCKVQEMKVCKGDKWGDVFDKIVKTHALGDEVKVIGNGDYLVMTGIAQNDIEYKKQMTMEKLVDSKEILLHKYLIVSDTNGKRLKIRIAFLNADENVEMN